MAEKEKIKAATENKTETSKTPIIAGVVVVAVIIVAGLFALSGNGVAESEEAELSQIAPAAANADDAPMIKLGNPVVAVVNDVEVKRSDVFNFISGLPEQVRQMPIQTLFPLALEQVVNNRVINVKAGTAKLEKDPEVEQLVSQAKDQIIRNIFVDREIKGQITQKKLLKSYSRLLDEIGEVQETKARHILVQEEEEALEVITLLEGGADFIETAKEHSTGPSAEKGGELGWFAENEMVAEFSQAAFALEPGSYTKDPIKTQFGWHIIKVEKRRQRPEPMFEVVKPQLETQLRQQVLNDLITSWQKEAKIEKYDINGDPVK